MLKFVVCEKNITIKFNDLEKKIYKFVCMLGCMILKYILEGWKKDNIRHPLVSKSYIAGMMSSKKLEKIRNAKIYQKYNEEKIELRVMNGDGARWIKNIACKGAISQKDNFHIHQEIVRDISEEK